MILTVPNSLGVRLQEFNHCHAKADGTFCSEPSASSIAASTWYHASTTQNIDRFTNDKIKGTDADAPYTGIWLSTDRHTSPAFVNPTALYVVEPRVSSLITRPDATKFARQLQRTYTDDVGRAAGAKGFGDYVRRTLLKAGYDAVLHEEKPVINMEELERTGTTTFQLNWRPAELRKSDFRGAPMYDLFQRGDHVTGFSHPQELIDQTPRTLVVLDADHAKITGRERSPWVRD